MCDSMEIDIVQELGAQPVKRPDDIEKDVNTLSQKKRVSNILSSPYFKEELEQAVTDVVCSNKFGEKSLAKELANFFSPFDAAGYKVLEAYGEMRGIQGLKAGVGIVSPINDLTGSEALVKYSKTERLLRCKLATLYRIVDLFGWTRTINDHISVRLNKEQEHFLVNPQGLLYHEISAAKLLKVNMQGEMIDQGSTTLSLDNTSFTLHSAIHAARPDLHCIIHVQTPELVAVSCMECGIVPLCQEALMIGEFSVHPYNGPITNAKERKALQKSLGATNKVMLLRNRGVLACGETIEEAFLHLNNTAIACSTQVKAMSCVRSDKLLQLSSSDFKPVDDLASSGAHHQRHASGGSSGDGDGTSKIKWKPGEMQFEALVRMLDNMGYRSGYNYRNPDVVKSKPKACSEVEEPPTVISHSQPLTADDLENIRGGLRKAENASRWVNSPNTYMKVEKSSSVDPSSADESHSSPARTTWLRSSSPSHYASAAVRTKPNQFVPTGTDPREVAATRNSIRGQALKHSNPPGPQSQILHSVAPKKSEAAISAASKGIIERGIEVSIVTPAGPPNPFSKISKEELDDYRRKTLKASSATSLSSEGSKQLKTVTEDVENGVEVALNGDHSESPAINGGADHDKENDEKQATDCQDITMTTAVEQQQVDDKKPSSCRASFEAAMTTEVVDKLMKTSDQVQEATAGVVGENEDQQVHKPPQQLDLTDSPTASANKKEKKKKRPLSFLKKKKQK